MSLNFSKLQEISAVIIVEVWDEAGWISTEEKLVKRFTELSRSSLRLPNRSYWVYRPSWGTAQGAWPGACAADRDVAMALIVRPTLAYFALSLRLGWRLERMTKERRNIAMKERKAGKKEGVAEGALRGMCVMRMSGASLRLKWEQSSSLTSVAQAAE